MSNLTDWIWNYRRPVRDGVYQRAVLSILDGTPLKKRFARYEKGVWYKGCSTKKQAARTQIPSPTQCKASKGRPFPLIVWRGLSYNPEA